MFLKWFVVPFAIAAAIGPAHAGPSDVSCDYSYEDVVEANDAAGYKLQAVLSDDLPGFVLTASAVSGRKIKGVTAATLVTDETGLNAIVETGGGCVMRLALRTNHRAKH